MATKQQTRKPAPKKAQDQEFTIEQRVEYFEWKLGYWERKLGRLIDPKKKARATKRVAHYKTKLAEATKLAAEKATGDE
jgi:hypothetical protein